MRSTTTTWPAPCWAIPVVVLFGLFPLAIGCGDSAPEQDSSPSTPAGEERSSEAKSNDSASANRFAEALWPIYWEQVERIKASGELDERLQGKLLEGTCRTLAIAGLFELLFENLDKILDGVPEARGPNKEYMQAAYRTAHYGSARKREFYQKAFEAGLLGEQENTHEVLRFLPWQLEDGFAQDAYEFARRIKVPEARCSALLMISDALYHQGGEEEALKAMEEAKEIIAQAAEPWPKNRLEAELAELTKASKPFSAAVLDELTAPWRDGKEDAVVAVETLVDYVQRLQRRGDQQGIDATLQYIEDNLLKDIVGVTPERGYSPSRPGSGAWYRLLDTCLETKRFDRALRLIAAMDRETQGQLEFVTQRLSQLCSHAFADFIVPPNDHRDVLPELLPLCKEVLEELPPGREKSSMHRTILRVNLLLGDKAGVRKAVQPYLAAVESPSSSQGEAFALIWALAETGEVDALQKLHDSAETESMRERHKAQLTKALTRRGRHDEALEMARRISSSKHRAEAMGLVAAHLHQTEGKDKVEQFVRRELAAMESRQPTETAELERLTDTMGFVSGLMMSGVTYLVSLDRSM